MYRVHWLLFLFLTTAPFLANGKDPRIALDSEYPDPAGAKAFSGEITLVEHVNRKGILRLDRDGTQNKYFWDLPHHFQMLPYSAIYYHGAPAGLKDIPVGTHLHGKFYLGPEGEFEVKPPTSNYFTTRAARPDLRSIESQYSRVLLLEDDCSYYQRRNLAWKITAISEDRRELKVELITTKSDAVKTGPDSLTLRIDRGTKVWKEKAIATLGDLAPDQVVQMNLGWVTLLGSFRQDGLCREVWIDEASREAARTVQMGIHIEHQKRRGLPAMIIKTEHDPGKGAKGWVTARLNQGTAPELLEELRNAKSVLTKCVEPTLRGYIAHSSCSGRVEKVTAIQSPPPGSSGVELLIHFYEMREGHRKGRTIRIAASDWFRPEVPREEYLRPADLRQFQVGPKYIVGRDLPKDKQEK